MAISKKWVHHRLVAFVLVVLSPVSSGGLCPLLVQRRSYTSTTTSKWKKDENCGSGSSWAATTRDWRKNHHHWATAAAAPRGGALDLDDEDASRNNDDSLEKGQQILSRRRRGMSLALFSTYFAVMGAKCALPSVFSLLTSPTSGLTFPDDGTPKQLMARVLTLSTMAIALGKALSGPLIDKFGGILSLQVTLSLLLMLMGVIASSQHFMTFAICWVFVDFIFSSCWASCVNAIHQSFPNQQWASRIGLLAAAARTGNASAFFAFSGVLKWAQKHATQQQQQRPWRLVFGVSAILQLVPISLVTYYGRFFTKKPNKLSSDDDYCADGRDNRRRTRAVSKTEQQQTQKSSLVTLRREAGTLEFWMHLTSRSALMVFGSFLLFVPCLMSDCYGMSSSAAANVGSIFALGCLLSVSMGAQWYSTLSSRRDKVMSVLVMMGMATLCSLAQLGHMMGLVSLSPFTSAALFFLWGFFFAIPFYIPPSLYALARGGSESSATIADVFDFGGFGLLAVFNGYVASIRHDVRTAWIPTFAILTICAITSWVSLALAVYFETDDESMQEEI